MQQRVIQNRIETDLRVERLDEMRCDICCGSIVVAYAKA